MNERDSKLKNEKDLRLKFYQGIRKAGDFNETFIAPPPSYWLSSNLFSLSPDFGNLTKLIKKMKRHLKKRHLY